MSTPDSPSSSSASSPSSTPPRGPATAPRAVLFDLDGVLVDSFEVWLAVVNETRERFNSPPVSREFVAGIFGQGIEADVVNLYPGRTREEVQRAYADALPRAMHRMGVNPEAALVLDALGRAGVRRAVVTNTQEPLARAVVTRAGLAAHLDACVGVGSGLREKPAPDLLLEALAQLGVAPADALMVGDTDYDERAARAAGTAFLRYEIRGGARLSERLDGVRPH